jgi:hypothetical protein
MMRYRARFVWPVLERICLTMLAGVLRGQEVLTYTSSGMYSLLSHSAVALLRS